MKEATKEAEVKAASAKADDYVSSSGTSSAATAASNSASMFVMDPHYAVSAVGVDRRSGYT